jgi:hypothetical protein
MTSRSGALAAVYGEAERRAVRITSAAELEARAAEIRLRYEPTGPCPNCGAPAEWRHAFGCPEDQEV